MQSFFVCCRILVFVLFCFICVLLGCLGFGGFFGGWALLVRLDSLNYFHQINVRVCFRKHKTKMNYGPDQKYPS